MFLVNDTAFFYLTYALLIVTCYYYMYKLFLLFFQLLIICSAVTVVAANNLPAQKIQQKQESLFADDAKAVNAQENEQREKDKPTKVAADIELLQVKYQGGMRTIVFDFKTQDKVCLASFYLEGSLWLVFDKYKQFELKKDDFFTDFTQIPHPEFTILKITHIDTGTALNCTKVSDKWHVRLGGVEINNASLPLKETKDKIVVLNNFSYNKSLDLKIRNHPTIRVIPLLAHFGRVNPQFHSNFLHFLPARNGIVFELPRHDLTTTLSNTKLELVQNDKLPNNATPFHISDEVIEEARNARNIDSDADVDQNSQELDKQPHRELVSILPDQQEVTGDSKFAATIDYLTQVQQIDKKIANAHSSDEAFNLILQLVYFYFTNGDYYQAQKRIEELSAQYSALYRKNFRIQFIRAVNTTMLCRFSEADRLFGELLTLSRKLPIYQEVLLWYNYNKFKMNPYTFQGLIGIKDEVVKLVEGYNDHLYWPLFLSELELSISKKNYARRTQLLQNARKAEKLRHKNSMTYLKAYYLSENNDKPNALSLLKGIMLFQDDPYNMQRSWLLSTQIKLALNLITTEKAIHILSMVQFLWRGDVLATNTLLYLAELQEKVGDYPQALRSYAKIIDYVPYTDLLFIRDKIHTLLSQVFLADDSESTAVRDFELVALFDEFQRFLPKTELGDQMVLSVAQRLENLGLLPQTEKLLLHQIKYRVQAEHRVVIANQLARLYIRMQEYQKAMDILNKTDLNNLSFALYQDRQALRIELLIKTGKYTEALKYVKGSDQDQFLDLKKELFFEAQLWQEYIDLMNFMHNNKGIAMSQNDILHLALAYYSLGDSAGLDKVITNFTVTDEDIKKNIDLLKSTVPTKSYDAIKNNL